MKKYKFPLSDGTIKIHESSADNSQKFEQWTFVNPEEQAIVQISRENGYLLVNVLDEMSETIN